MRTVVPYKRYAVSALRYAPIPKRARLAYRVAATAYNHRGKVSKAARIIGRAYRAYKSRVRKVGNAPGKSESSRTERALDQTYSTRSLHSIEMILITRNETTSIDIRNRERDTVVIKGIKVCIEFRNFESHLLLCNLAILHPKTSLGAGNQVPVDEFFRSYGIDRARDFDPTTDTPNDLHCLPINTDRYVVLRHKRFTLGPSGAMSTGATRQPWKQVDMYLKLNRQIRFEGADATDLREGQLYAVWWFDSPDAIAGTVPVASACRVLQRYVIYFKNPK